MTPLYHLLHCATLSALITFLHASCPNSNYLDTYGNNKCYRAVQTSKHSEAVSACQADGATLPVILSYDDNVAVNNAASSGLPWLGLQCATDESCVWDDGTAYDSTTFNNFDGGSE